MEHKYDVGYAKPPKHSRFKKGRSGNPKGRPKGSRNFSTDVKETLEEPVRVTSQGKARTVSTQHAALMRLKEKALGGDARALDRVIELARLYNDDEMAEAASRMDATDAEILSDYDAKVLRRAGMVPNGAQKRRGKRKPPDDDALERVSDDDRLH